AGRSHRKTFSHEKEAQKFAREQAEKLAAGDRAISVDYTARTQLSSKRSTKPPRVKACTGQMIPGVRHHADSETRPQTPFCHSTVKALLSPFALLLTFLCTVSADPVPAKDRIVILITIDGFPAWIWKDPHLVIPNLRKLAAAGATAE